MSVKKEETKNVKLSAKGVLIGISQDGFVVEDEKDGSEEVLSIKDIQELIGKSVTITFANKELLDEE